jgi:hypothetical protein
MFSADAFFLHLPVVSRVLFYDYGHYLRFGHQRASIADVTEVTARFVLLYLVSQLPMVLVAIFKMIFWLFFFISRRRYDFDLISWWSASHDKHFAVTCDRIRLKFNPLNLFASFSCKKDCLKSQTCTRIVLVFFGQTYFVIFGVHLVVSFQLSSGFY